MTTKKTFFALILSAVMCVPFTMSAQVTIGSGRAPSEWSLLDLCTDEQQKALHNARMNEIQRDRLMSPNTNYHSLEDQRAAQGLMIFRTDAVRVSENPNEYVGCLEFWNGERWVSLCKDRLRPTTVLTVEPSEVGFWWLEPYLLAGFGSGYRVLQVTVTNPPVTRPGQPTWGVSDAIENQGWFQIHIQNETLPYSITIYVTQPNCTPFQRYATFRISTYCGTETKNIMFWQMEYLEGGSIGGICYP